MKGFCPSFVTVEGGELRKGKASGAAALGRLAEALPEPQLPDTAAPWGILITGVGGTGVVTIGALLGMAAHLEGKGISVLDMAGLAQKGGAVWSHVRIADRQAQLHAARVAAGEADAVIGCDLVVAASDESLAKMQHGRTRVLINRDQTNTSEFVRGFAAQARSGDVLANPDPQFPAAAMEAQIVDAVGADKAEFLDATAHRHRAARRLDRHQPVHARLRLAARPGAAVAAGDRARDRDQRRRGRGQQGRLPVGPPRRGRPACGARGRQAPLRHARAPPPFDQRRRADRPPQGAADRLPGRRLRRALRARWSSACAPPRPGSPPASSC